MLGKALFFGAILLAISPWGSPPLALACGLLLGLTLGNPFRQQSRKGAKLLLQACVVGLGFGINLYQVIAAGRSGFLYTAIGISVTLALGLALGALIGVAKVERLLISVGTAICGGSAIAAVGPVIEATEEQMSISLGTVFILNSIALLTFPAIGMHLHLSQQAFGLWAALAIHDTSSVVGAAAKYGPTALAIATTVKLARALWIVPVTLLLAAIRKSNGRVQWPWFIALYVVASMIATFLPAPALYALITMAAKKGLAVTLFLIGANVSRDTLREVGPRPMLHGVLLWLIVSTVTLAAIEYGLISI